MRARAGESRRKTKETDIAVRLSPDGSGAVKASTGIPFFDHMLAAFGKHGGFDLDVKAKGDLHVDPHHTVEDVGIVLGQALTKALGDKNGIARYGDAAVPMDEALVQAALDISGRPGYVQDFDLKRKRIGSFDTDLVDEFWKGFTLHSGVTLHLRQIRGRNSHHIIEAAFKAFGRALGAACARSGRSGIPSTKGSL